MTLLSANDLTVSCGYNPASQLISRNASNDTYVWLRPATGTATYSAANGLNQYPSIAGAAYGYDANGNLTTGGSRTRAYDVENRLTGVTGGSIPMFLEYDPLGRLHSKYTTGPGYDHFLYSGDQLVGEQFGGSTSIDRRYVHGAGIDEPLVWYEGGDASDRRWLLADERGSIIADTTAAGAATPYSYGPYGEPNAWTGSRFRYTGQIMLPEAQLYHYKARAYDPGIGRFLQTDPVGYQDHLNLYSYVGNDPLNRADPTGQWCILGWGSTCDPVDLSYRQSFDARADELFGPLSSQADEAVDFWVDQGGLAGVTFGTFAATVNSDNINNTAVTAGSAVLGGTVVKGGVTLSKSISSAAKVGASQARSAIQAERLRKQLASEEGVAEVASGAGKIIAGPGANVPLRDAGRLVSQHGGKSTDWVKVTSTAEGRLQTHAYRNMRTGEVVELKSILP